MSINFSELTKDNPDPEKFVYLGNPTINIIGFVLSVLAALVLLAGSLF